MKTIVLPGFSITNRDWAYDMKAKLGKETIVHNWIHWQEGGGLKLKRELEIILKEIGSSKVNIIAKSVGTFVAMKVLEVIPKHINKIILCGIPSTSNERKSLFTTSLSGFPVKDIVVFQNTKDFFVSYKHILAFMKKVNPKIKVIEKPRSDHNYPYFDNFIKFLA